MFIIILNSDLKDELFHIRLELNSDIEYEWDYEYETKLYFYYFNDIYMRDVLDLCYDEIKETCKYETNINKTIDLTFEYCKWNEECLWNNYCQ